MTGDKFFSRCGNKNVLELIIVLSVLGAVLVILFGALAWAMYGMYRGLANARTGLIRAKEAIELTRHAIEIQEKGLDLAEQLLKKQDEIIRLLRELVEDRGRFTSTQS